MRTTERVGSTGCTGPWRQCQHRAQVASLGARRGFGLQCTGICIRAVAGAAGPAGRDIHIELRRGAVQMVVRWPLDGAAVLAQWTRELLR